MRLKRTLFGLGLLLVLASAPLAAQTQIKADPQKNFKHKPSGIVLAASAAGIPRTLVEQFDDKQLDVAAEFRTSDDKEITTIYVFRKVTGDVPLWFDRIQHLVEAKKALSSPTLVIPPAAFVPPGQSNARGLRAVYAAGAPPWKSTAAALTTTGDWYVSVRLSSQTLTPEQLLARLAQTFAGIRWPKEKVASPVAEPVASCAGALSQGEDAKPANTELAEILLSAAAATAEESLSIRESDKPVRWCRDTYESSSAGVYRPDGATDRYFVAFQDAGRGIFVGPNHMAAILAKAQGAPDLTFAVELVEIDHHTGFGSFKTLPSVAQAIWLIEKGTSLYSASTWGKNKNIEINSDVAK